MPYLERELALLERCETIVASAASPGTARCERYAASATSPETEAPLRPRRRGAGRPLDAARLLPPEPAEHLHRSPHRADARPGLRPRPRAGAGRYGASVPPPPVSRCGDRLERRQHDRDRLAGLRRRSGAWRSAPGSPHLFECCLISPMQFLPSAAVEDRQAAQVPCSRASKVRLRSAPTSLDDRLGIARARSDRIGAGMLPPVASSK